VPGNLGKGQGLKLKLNSPVLAVRGIVDYYDPPGIEDFVVPDI
jgi:hypothetical protein